MPRQRPETTIKSPAPKLRRNSDEAKANKAAALANNPTFNEAFTAAREGFIGQLERLNLDGSVQAENKALEIVRQLQVLTEVRRKLLGPVSKVKLKEHADAARNARK